MLNVKKLLGAASLAVVALLGFIAPAAAAVDVSGVVTEIGGAVAPIVAIGGAVLLVIVAAKIYKWVRQAM